MQSKEEIKDPNSGDLSYQNCYEAKKDGRFFSATTPEELLGLIALWEERGDRWRDASKEEWRNYNELEDNCRIYDEADNDVTDRE